MTKKELFIEFIENTETDDGIIKKLVTVEKPLIEDDTPTERQWLYPKQDFIDLIESNFDDELHGHLMDQNQTEVTINSWYLKGE